MLETPDDDNTTSIVYQLIHIADSFISCARTTPTNSADGLAAYHKMMKSALTAFLAAKKRANLEPLKTQSYLHYRIACFYYEETQQLDRSEEYARHAISLVSRLPDALDLRFHSEFLTAKILIKTKSPVVLSYLTTSLANYTTRSDLSICFRLLQLDYLLSSDPDAGLVELQKLAKEPLDENTTILCNLYQCNMHIYRGSPKIARKLIREVEHMNLNQTPLYPYYLLIKFHILIQTDPARAKVHQKVVGEYVAAQYESEWSSWCNQISINKYTTKWLTPEEFVAAFYFFTGVNLLCEVANGKKKALKVFDKCVRVIDKLLKTASDYQACIRLKYIRFSTHYYQAWAGFLCNEPRPVSYLNEFMSCYNKGFSDVEMATYGMLIPRVLYLFAVYYQGIGDIQAAKYYYIKVRSLLSLQKSDPYNPLIALEGKNTYSELFVYSSIHLLILTEYEINICKGEVPGKYFQLKSQLYEDLSSVFTSTSQGNAFLQNFASSNELLSLTRDILLHIYNGAGGIESIGKSFDKMRDLVCFPLMSNLISYLVFVGSKDPDQKNINLERCLKTIGETAQSDAERIVNVFILRSVIQEFKASGENDKVSSAEFQLRFFDGALEEKFTFARQNAQI